jgi:hypothetical protein
MTLLLVNSAINPLIYAYRMRDLRKAFYKLFRIDGCSGVAESNND